MQSITAAEKVNFLTWGANNILMPITKLKLVLPDVYETPLDMGEVEMRVNELRGNK